MNRSHKTLRGSALSYRIAVWSYHFSSNKYNAEKKYIERKIVANLSHNRALYISKKKSVLVFGRRPKANVAKGKLLGPEKIGSAQESEGKKGKTLVARPTLQVRLIIISYSFSRCGWCSIFLRGLEWVVWIRVWTAKLSRELWHVCSLPIQNSWR